MNIDQDVEDAREAHEEQELNYPTVLARDVRDLYKVRAYPTIIVLDREGTVRHVHVGFRSNLAETLQSEVEKLLAEK